jgi:NitT/TauT family transport system substrate-binding protein
MKRVGYIEGKIDIKKQIDVSLYREALESLLKEEPNDPTWLKFRADYEKNNGAWS